MRYQLITCCLLIASLWACVESYSSFEPSFSSNYTYIQAAVSNLPDQRTVSINRLEAVTVTTSPQPIRGCQVRVQAGNLPAVTLREQAPGRYELPATFIFRVGQAYQLLITLPDGRQLTSTAEIMPDSVRVKQLRAEFSTNQVRQSGGTAQSAGHLIYGDFDDVPGTRNFFRLNWKDWERQEFCKVCNNSVLYQQGDTACSYEAAGRIGYPVRPDGSLIPSRNGVVPSPWAFDYRCSELCWQCVYNSSVSVFSDANSNGRSVTNLLMGSIPIYTATGFLVETRLESITKGYYDYLKLLENQVTQAGGIADTPPAPIRGNFRVTSEPQATDVLGYFTVVGVATQNLYVPRVGIDFQRYPPVGLLGRKSYNEEPLVRRLPVFGPPIHPPIPTYPCIANAPDGGFRSPYKPQGWPN